DMDEKVIRLGKYFELNSFYYKRNFFYNKDNEIFLYFIEI
ncbi:unnamed protein product, partial [marine sediment metagenome]